MQLYRARDSANALYEAGSPLELQTHDFKDQNKHSRRTIAKRRSIVES